MTNNNQSKININNKKKNENKKSNSNNSGNFYQSNIYLNFNVVEKANRSKFHKSIINNINKIRNNSNSKIYNLQKRSTDLNSVKIIDSKKVINNGNFNKKIENYDLSYRNLNDQELNTLVYKLALELDKRTYFQYYWSLLKKKQLIIFSFIPNNDYNLITIKISLFLISISLYFTVNGFFFSDKTMHKVYEDKGKYDIMFQIPKLIYSTLVSTGINMILKTLSLSENSILEIKKMRNMKDALEKSKRAEYCLKIKFAIFYILSFIIMSFFWYFISCFCAVYINTQIILIKDTIISFTLSMIYPFGFNLLPAIFRIVSLRAKKKDKECIYKVSGIIALI